MKKSIFGFGLLCLAILTMSFGKNDKLFHFKGKGFSIDFPQKVKTEKSKLPSEIGELTLEMTMYDASGDKSDENMYYALISTDYPKAVADFKDKEVQERMLKAGVDGAVKNVNGELISEKSIELKGYLGKEFKINYQNGTAIITARCYLILNKMVILQTIATQAKDGNASSANFFNSFQIED